MRLRINRLIRAGRTFNNLNRWVSPRYKNARPYLRINFFPFSCRWIAVRMDALSAIFTGGLAVHLIYGGGARSPSTIGFVLHMAGLFLSIFVLSAAWLSVYAASFSSLILLAVRVFNDFESKSTPCSTDSCVSNLCLSVSGNRYIVYRHLLSGCR